MTVQYCLYSSQNIPLELYSYRVTCFRMGGNQVDDPEIPDTGTRSFKIIARLKVQRKLSALTALTKDWAKILKRPEVGIYIRKKSEKERKNAFD